MKEEGKRSEGYWLEVIVFLQIIDNSDYNEDTYAESWVFFFCWNIVIFDIKFGFNVEKQYICGDIVHFTMHSTG